MLTVFAKRAVPNWMRGPRCVLLMMAMLLIGLGGCVNLDSDSASDKPRKIQTLWPEPPEQPRYAFQAVLRSLADIRVETEDERFQRLVTGRGISDQVAYEKPASLAAFGGRIYVADSVARVVVVFDVPRGRVFRFGLREPNVLRKPTSLALDEQGRVYVLDTTAKKVMAFDGLGLFLFDVDLREDFVRPVGLAVSGGGERIYVVDRGSLNDDDHKVVVYSPAGEKLQVLGPRGKGDGEFNIPLEAVVAPDGSLAVLDSGNFRVQVFDAEGRFVRSFGSLGNRAGQFARPRGLAVDRDGNYYVSDASFNNVQVFNNEGQLLLPIGATDMLGGPGGYALIGAVAADEKGHLYVADSFFRKIEVFRRLSDREGLAMMKMK